MNARRAEGKEQAQAPIERWRLWLGRLLLIPLTATSGGMIFGLYRAVVTGELTTVSKGYRASSHIRYFAESPVSFLLLFALYLALTGLIVFVTVLVAGRVIPKTTPN